MLCRLFLTLSILGFCLSGCAGSSGAQDKEWKPPPHTPINPVSFDLDSINLDQAIFPSTVMAGDPSPSSILLWTQTRQTENIKLKVWIPDIDPQDPDLLDLLFDQTISVEDGGFVHQLVDQVVPGLRHGYAFFKEEQPGNPTARSRIGYFIAAPPEGALVRMTFSGTHGTKEEHAPYPTLAKNAEFEPFCLYLHMGDAIYADSAETQEDYRAMWQANWQTAGFQAVLSEAVYLPVPDDHEVENNYSPESTDPAKIEIAVEAFYEANPLSRQADHPKRYWRSWKWGDTVEFFALDCRGERLPSTRETAEAVYISPEQMAWLKQGLLDSTATFKLILNTAPIIDMPEIWANIYDRWEGYLAQRNELIQFLLSENIPNLYFITGDFHMAMIGRLDPPGGDAYNMWEFILGPGAQSNPLGDREYMIELTNGEVDPLPPEQFLWGFPTELLSYVDLDPIADPPELTLRYYQPDGTELYSLTFVGGQLLEH